VPLAVAFPAGSLLAEIAHGPKDAPMTRQMSTQVPAAQTQNTEQRPADLGKRRPSTPPTPPGQRKSPRQDRQAPRGDRRLTPCPTGAYVVIVASLVALFLLQPDAMLFRVFWPSPADQTGVLVGWWLTEEGYVVKDAGEAEVRAAFVACIRPSLSEAESQLGMPKVLGHPEMSCLAILGDSQAGAEAEQLRTQRPWIRNRCDKNRSLRLSVSGAKIPAPTSVQIVVYHLPARRGVLTEAVLGVRPKWLDAGGASSSVPTQLEAVLPLLDLAPEVSETTGAFQSLSAERPGAGMIRWVLSCASSACAVCSSFSGLLLGCFSWRLDRSAVISQLQIRLHLQSQWLACQICSSSEGARDPGPRARLALAALVFSSLADALLGALVVSAFSWLGGTCDICDMLTPARLHRWAYEVKLVKLVTWLMGAPADFKLNRQLTSFAGHLFLSMFSLWGRWVLQLLLAASGAVRMLWALHYVRSFDSVLVILGFSLGLSGLVACVMDLIAIASLPLFVAYLGTCLCWKMATRSLYTLSLLFQGWKHNILRSRIDHHNFDVDQLLIGVILLSIVVFLLPSLFMFYSCFTCSWLLVLVAHYALGLLVSLSSHQPSCLVALEPRARRLMLQVLEVRPSQSTLSLSLLPPVGAEGPAAGLSKTLKGAFLLSPISLKTWLSSLLYGEPLPLCRLQRPSPLSESEPARLAEVLRLIWKRQRISRGSQPFQPRPRKATVSQQRSIQAWCSHVGLRVKMADGQLDFIDRGMQAAPATSRIRTAPLLRAAEPKKPAPRAHDQERSGSFSAVPKALALLAALSGRGRSLALRAEEKVRDADDAVAEARWQLDRRFVGIALPAFAQLLTEPLATVVDTACCGRLGVAALGGMGVAVSAQYSLTKTFNDPLLRVTVSLVATTSPEDRREAVSAVVLLALLLGFVQVATFGVATGLAIQGMGVDPTSSMFGRAVAYLRFRALGAPFGSMLLALTGICRGLGDARTPMVASALATAVNVFLDPLLIFGLGWGCAGAAVATVAAQFAGVLCIAWKLRALFSGSRAPRWASISAALRRFVTTAGVMIVRNWGKVFCFTFLARHAAQQGAIVSAAYSLTFQLGFATSQVAESLATSTQVLLAQALRDDGSFAPLSASRSARQVVLRGLQ
ncbi:DTX45, partial [Symbiodinium sp. KB8]